MPIVLINGGPGGTHHEFHPYFGRAASFAQVVYYDQRGCGRSDYKPGPGYTVDQAVNDLDKLREALKIDRWTVLGWSYGGALAQLYTLKHPEYTAGLVLVGSTDDGWLLQLQAGREYDYFSTEEKKRVAEILQGPVSARGQARLQHPSQWRLEAAELPQASPRGTGPHGTLRVEA